MLSPSKSQKLSDVRFELLAVWCLQSLSALAQHSQKKPENKAKTRSFQMYVLSFWRGGFLAQHNQKNQKAQQEPEAMRCTFGAFGCVVLWRSTVIKTRNASTTSEALRRTFSDFGALAERFHNRKKTRKKPESVRCTFGAFGSVGLAQGPRQS